MTRRVLDALKSAGAVLKRKKKHLVYELPSGQNVVVASTPSDFRSENNALREIRKATGDTKPGVAVVGVRRERTKKPGRAREEWTCKAPTIAAKLREAGVVERSQTEQIVSLEEALRMEIQLVDELHIDLTRARTEMEAATATRWFRIGRRLGLIECQQTHSTAA